MGGSLQLVVVLCFGQMCRSSIRMSFSRKRHPRLPCSVVAPVSLIAVYHLAPRSLLLEICLSLFAAWKCTLVTPCAHPYCPDRKRHGTVGERMGRRRRVEWSEAEAEVTARREMKARASDEGDDETRKVDARWKKTHVERRHGKDRTRR